MVFQFANRESFRWKVAELTPGKSVRWECVEGPGAAAGTAVTYRLSAVGDNRTEVKCSHEGRPMSHDALATSNTLWGILMGRSRDYAESNQPTPAFH